MHERIRGTVVGSRQKMRAPTAGARECVRSHKFGFLAVRGKRLFTAFYFYLLPPANPKLRRGTTHPS